MLNVSTAIEEQLISRAIKEECSWESLPKRLQTSLNSKDEWHRRIIAHSIKKRLLWRTSFVRKVCREGEYYEDMMRYLRKNLALFPYHLAEYVCRVMRISPFRYYCDIIFEVMKNEQPYDRIPNFSAADALRLTGIGRNEFIDIMNKCKSKKIMWKLNKSIARESLPLQPVDITIEPWWGVCLVNFTLEEFKKLSEEEIATIDRICKEEANAFMLFDPVVIKGLYRRGLVYLDVCVYAEDRFKVCRLEGFVSNREQSYEDPIEELLYAVFVVSSENSTVAELATTLQVELSQLQAASSFACRLGWAVKLIDPGSILQESSTTSSYKNALSDEEESSRASVGSFNMSVDGSVFQQDGADSSGPSSGYARVAFVVDANITSYLMMGSVSPGLKSHAVTLYEAGKLGHASIKDLCQDLSTLEGAKFEGVLQEFANHAFSLRCVLECLTSGGIAPNEGDKPDMDSSSNEEATSMTADKLQREESGHAVINESGVLDDSVSSAMPKEDVDSHSPVTEDTNDVNSLPTISADDSEGSNLDHGSQDDVKLVSAEGSDVGDIVTRKIRKYQVDVLRCESLATLSAATLDRLFRRDYEIVVSMLPLPHNSVLPGPRGPVHFGPPSYTSMTPWMKLVLYSAAGGPLSVVFMKGQCLRLLPAPLSGCEKALVWSWNESSVEDKFQGGLVKGNILLHFLNSLLKHTAILVQPLSRYDLDGSGKMNTMDVPLPLKNSNGSFADIGKELGLGTDESSKLNFLLNTLANKIELWTVGYIRLLKLFKESDPNSFAPDHDNYEWVPLSVEFGIPLFSPNLCKNICKRVVSSQLLQTNLFTEHHNAMQELRKRLQNVCSQYQATGSTARILYQRDQPKTQNKLLMTYASQRWNPLTDPSSPISGMSDHQRLKIANRQRCGTEVLSFDGNILRSYALSPVYESPLSLFDETPDLTGDKSDEMDTREAILPGVNLLFDGSELRPFDIGACLQARQPVSLIVEASVASAASSGVK
ncbi:protein FAM91A1-like [Cynara cardunculus var. scolymus]|uniref:protein FAM91A1-like n=1 Tax=Cynara cardunculus var. scolymus TaxID=59895 RepID=UPI000D62A9E0|nr:protein FAM91A1-like [Cynara cardunculus var. scolymus]